MQLIFILVKHTKILGILYIAHTTVKHAVCQGLNTSIEIDHMPVLECVPKQNQTPTNFSKSQLLPFICTPSRHLFWGFCIQVCIIHRRQLKE
jgi:hypothetical protein